MLDIGAKQGGLGLRAREAGFDIEYVGLELSDANVRAAAARSLDVRQADVTERLPVYDAEYDCVFCLELLQHLRAPLSLLAEMRRAVKKGGRVVVSVPNPYSWLEVYRELLHRHDPEGSLSAFTTPVMQNLAARAGFTLERTGGTVVRVPRSTRLIPTDSILAHSRIYVLRATDQGVFG